MKIGFLGLLTLLLVALKGFGYITISWFWVFAPIMLGLVVALFMFAVIFGIAVLANKR